MRTSRWRRARVLALAGLLSAPALAAPEPPPAKVSGDGEALYAARCASCHDDAAGTKAPSLLAMRQMSIAQVYFSLSNGKMKSQAAGLGPAEIGALALFASNQAEPHRPSAGTMCKERAPLGRALVSRWGIDEQSSRSQSSAVTSVNQQNVAALELAWAFGLPSSAEARSQPVITESTLFVAATGSGVFALDRRSGCIRWHQPRAAPLRTALTLGRITHEQKTRDVLFVGDAASFVAALDAETGAELWRQHVGLFETSILTGAPIQHGERLLVPISLIDVALARDPSFPCCKAHGAVRALEANSGKILWTAHLTPDAEPRPASAAGVAQWGPSGVAVWSTPTIDAKRKLVYVGTGQNASSPATELSDAIVALDLESGAIRWRFQPVPNDAFNDSCASMPKGPNCPSENGPDFDFGASVAMTRDSKGKELLVAAQKSGQVYALDPAAGGKLVWKQRVGAGSALGGVHWGVAVDAGAIYVPVADPPFPIPDYVPRPGLVKLRLDDGSLLWERRVERGCTTDFMAYIQRDVLYPACSFYFGLSAAPTLIPGVVFVGALDGRVRAFASGTGEILWQYDTARAFESVNGVPAHGGSIDNAGVLAAGDMIYVQSGYSLFGELPGNALLAFKLSEKK